MTKRKPVHKYDGRTRSMKRLGLKKRMMNDLTNSPVIGGRGHLG